MLPVKEAREGRLKSKGDANEVQTKHKTKPETVADHISIAVY